MPEAALDRFLARIELGYPDEAQEVALYTGRDTEAALGEVRPVLAREQLLAAQAAVTGVLVRDPVAEYVLRVVAATREHTEVALGASPRAALMWLRAAKGRAWLHGRDYVLPDDLKALALPVLAHRMFVRGGGSTEAMLREVLAAVAVPL
jgi:MoxR-like ATPase